MKFSKKNWKQQALYGLLAVIAILAGITLLNSINDRTAFDKLQQEAADKLKQEQEQQAQNALAQIQGAQMYQRYCTRGVARIDTAGDIVKIVSSVTSVAPKYFKENQQIICTTKTTTPDCEAIKNFEFQTAYVCTPSPVGTALMEGNGIQVKNQVVGTAVVIDKVVLTQPTFIVVQDSTVQRKPGTILASSQLLRTGYNQIVSIAIPKPLIVNRRYFVTLYADTDNNGLFSNTQDKPLVDKNSKTLSAEFLTIREQ